jgi:Endodeoxyribonuclease RusA
VVAAQGHPMKIKDVDNSAKAILDTMKGIVFPDDRQIEHLSTSRIQHEDTPAYYLIYLRPVYPMLEDAIDRKCRVKLAGLVKQVEE